MAGGIGIIVLLLFVVVAVVMFITNGNEFEKFHYIEKEAIELEYGVEGIVKEKKSKYMNVYNIKTAISTALCILSVIPLFVMMIIEANDFWCVVAVAILLCIIAVAVSQFIIIGEIKGSYDQLLQEGDYTANNKKSDNLVGKIGAIYWPVMVAIYLGYSFITMKWEISWVIWPVAGILFGAIAGICKMVKE